MRRKTKIVCTLGPASSDENTIRELILAGMDVARFNFSHGAHPDHLEKFQTLKKVREELGLFVAAMLDTKGPEVRLGKFENGSVELKPDAVFTLTTEETVGNEKIASITYKNLPQDVHPGNVILIDDGLIELNVIEVKGSEIICRVVNGGKVSDRKGINVPNVDLSMPYLSDRDRADIAFAVKHGFDFIAASFVRSASDVFQVRRLLSDLGCKTINIISKIENRSGVENIDEIIAASDGIMVARGDMGVEIPFEEVPGIQKLIIEKVYNAGKQVITATQMLESMIKNPRPTRAEATDVANAIYDGTSALMLSGETAAGLYPVEAVKTMAKIARRTEKNINYARLFRQRENTVNPDITNAISHAAVTTAHDLGAAAVVTVSKSGKTVRMISKYRPQCGIIGYSTYEHVCRQLNLSWGVTPLLLEEEKSTDDLFDHAVDKALDEGLVKQGEIVVITAGIPLGVSGTTNLMRVHVAGHILVSGEGLNEKQAVAPLCVCRDISQVKEKFTPGDIIVVPYTSNEIIQYLKTAAGIITEEAGDTSHAAIVGLSLDIPVIIGATNATKILRPGAVVTLDSAKGVVYTN